MSSDEFDIIFRGDIVIGHQLPEVKQRLQQLFKIDAAKVDALFTGRPIPLKRSLDEATANKYRDVLIKAGAQVSVSPSGSVKVTAPAAPVRPIVTNSMSANSVSVESAAESSAPQGLSLAPVGSYLLTPVERPKVSPILINTDAISLRPAVGNLLDSSELPVQAETPILALDFDLADLGADLVREDEKMSLPLVEVDSEDWGLAEVGSNLLAPEERPQPSLTIVSINDFGLAPVGSDLGQLKLEVKPITPDISGISLAD